MKTRFLIFALSAVALLLGSGCQTVDTRIKKQPEVFAKFDPITQDKIKHGIIDLGFTEEMVYLALGTPDKKREIVSTQGRAVTWVYGTYYQSYYGGFYGYGGYGGYYGHYGPGYWPYRGFYYPGYSSVYVTTHDDRLRVVFKDGKVSVIEQTKDS